MKNSVKLNRRSEKQIRALLSIQDKSDTPVVAFCKAHKIHKATYYNWRNKYGAEIEIAANFIPVQFSQDDPVPALFGEIEFPSRVIVKLYQPVDASWFKTLLS